VPDNVIILAGIGNSGPQHWQSIWQKKNPNFVKVEQRDWDRPICSEWTATLESAVQHSGPNVVLVAHSLACLVVAHWAAQEHAPIKAAMLVAVPDPRGPNFPKQALGFSTTPEKSFSFPSIVVISTDDPYGTIENSTRLANSWGSRIVNIGARGHINAQSDLGDWPEGFDLLPQLIA